MGLLSNQKFMIEPTLINLHPNEYITTMHLRLIQIAVLEVVILLMIHLIKYVFQTKRKN